jgi:multidrug efflux pump
LAVFSGMLGVTLFGIFLTPVFFNVVDWLGSTRGFESRPMRWIRFITLEIFALGFVVTLVRLLTDWGRNARRRARMVDRSDGTDNPK